MPTNKKLIEVEKHGRTEWITIKIDGKIVAEMTLGQWGALIVHGKITLDSNDRPPNPLASI